jgi:hypothetical protein
MEDPYNFISLAAITLSVFSEITGISISEIKGMTKNELEKDARFFDRYDR